MQIERHLKPLVALKAFALDIKFAHSLFVLPFAGSVFFFTPLVIPTLWQFGLLLLCMIFARTFSMGFNRYIDRTLDSKNPRTGSRMIPRGILTATEGLTWTVTAGLLFIICAGLLNPNAGILSLPLLIILAAYSTTKRFTWLCHWYLGFCLAMAPIAVAVALGGEVTVPLLLIAGAVFLWTAGFDILYSLQDLRFDREHRLYSIPVLVGPRHALYMSRICFLGMIVLMIVAGDLTSKGAYYFGGSMLIAGILGYEHFLVRDARIDGVSKNLKRAFFDLNASVSVIFLLFCLLDAML